MISLECVPRFTMWEDFQFSGPQFIYRIMHSFKYGGYCPHTPVKILNLVIFLFFGLFLEIDTLSILIATVDMRLGILPGTATHYVCHKWVKDSAMITLQHFFGLLTAKSGLELVCNMFCVTYLFCCQLNYFMLVLQQFQQ